MAITLLESFDGWSTVAQMTNQSTSLAGGNKWLQSTASGHNNWGFDAGGRTGQALKKTSTTGGYLSGYLGTVTTEVVIGFAYNPASLSGAHELMMGLDGSAATQHFFLTQVNDTLVGTRIATNTGLTAFTTVPLLTAGSWNNYIEIYFKLHDTSGAYTLKFNGILAGSFSGDTQRTSSTGAVSYVALGGPTASSVEVGTMFDDLYAVNTLTGGQNVGFLGDTKVHCIRPDGNGSDSDWVGSDGNSTDNYLLVDEQNVSDADYVQSTSDADRDLYTFENPTITGSIQGIQHVARAARLSDADPKNINLIQKLSGGTETTALQTLNTTMKERWLIDEEKPGGGLWTSTDLNGASFGYEQVDA